MAWRPESADDGGLRKLKASLKSGEFDRLYLFHGEERYLQEYYLAALRKKLADGPAADFNFHRLTEENMSPETFADAVEAMPMMAEKTMVQVDDYDLFQKDEGAREKLMAVLSDIPDYCCVVFYYDTLAFKKDGKMRKMSDTLKKYATDVDFRRQTGTELNDWIVRHFRTAGKTIDTDTCQYLAFVTGGTMTALSSEIKKISAYCQGTTITRREIDAVVEPVIDAVVFDMTDALAAGDYEKALRVLFDLMRKREEPIAVLAAVGSHFRRLYAAKTVLSAGKGADKLMGLVGTSSDGYARRLLSQAGRISEALCAKAMLLCYEADRKLKSSQDDPARVLEMLLLELAQEKRR